MDIKKSYSGINPFRLAELVVGKPINWDKYSDETQALCGILNISKRELLSQNCPIIHPYTAISQDGTVKELSEDEAKLRLETFLASHTKRRITKTPPMRRLTLKTLRSRIPDILIPHFPDEKLPAPDFHEIPEKPFRPPELPPRPKNGEWHPAGLEWKDMGEYFKEVPEFDDPCQGLVGDCYLIAAFSSIVWTRSYVITNVAKTSSLGDDEGPIHRITFYNNENPESVEVSEKILVDSNNQIRFASSCDNKEVWPAVLEKAYAKWKTKAKHDCPNILRLNKGVATVACADIIGGVRHSYDSDMYTSDQIMSIIKKNCDGKKAINPMFALTPGFEDGDPMIDRYEHAGIGTFHFYSILGWEEKAGKQYVVLRNPWGHGAATINVLSGEWNFDENNKTPNIEYSNGIFAIEINTYLEYFIETSYVTDDLFQGK